ncbi:MAG: translation initiation factor IF-2 [Calditrichaeota bacterium]|nr:translation initiation factor IF-2 [Calditrichota bacterium]
MPEEPTKTRKVYEVAKELNTATPTVLEYLESKGYDVKRKQMSPVSEEMFVELMKRFDKQRYQRYLGEHTVGREGEFKRETVRLREAELEKLLAAKGVTAAPSKQAPKKIELPKFQEFVVEAAPPRPEPAAVEPQVELSVISERPFEALKPAVGEAQPSASIPPAVAPSVKIRPAVVPPAGSPLKAPKISEPAAVSPKTKPVQPGPASAPAPAKRKIELPKIVPLVIVEAAPSQPKKKLKRKRVAAKVETIAEAIETEVETRLAKEKAKTVKGKPAVKAVEGAVSKRRRRRRGKGGGAAAVEAAPAAAKLAPEKRKARKVSQKEVAATIRKTIAAMDDHGKRRYRRERQAATSDLPQTGALKVTEFLTTAELAAMIEVPVQDLIKRCLEMGMIVSINQRLDRDVIVLLAAEFNVEVEFVKEEEMELEDEEVNLENLQPRQPVVTVMGHVDHGKTTLLDYLRRTRVAEKEAGGITQHIGAYEVDYQSHRITFLDTPGHEAFTAMRARGAQSTDIVILVVASDDKVMPQTLEAIDHARAAGVPIVVAINKIDKPTANPDAIYKQLADNNLLVEKWGGKYQSAEISAKFGQNIDDLLSELLVAAELLDLKSDPTARAKGPIIEARLDKGLGVVATTLVQTGTLRVGDCFVAGQQYGRVRMLLNENGAMVANTGPGKPIQVVGFNGVPQAGDYLLVYPTEREVRDIALRRQQQYRELSMRQIRALSLEQMSKRMAERDLKELGLVIKGDVHGSIEVLADALMKLSNSEVLVKIIRRGVGAITESDILLAAASGAIVIGFHVHPNPQARELARNEGVEIRSYRIIHEVVDDVRKAMEGMLAPLREEKIIGQVEIRKIFKISRVGTVAGCYVQEGKVTRNNRVRLLRDNVEIWSGNLSSLKRFKDDAREVIAGFECGISLDGFNDINENDRLEIIEIVETSRKLETVN